MASLCYLTVVVFLVCCSTATVGKKNATIQPRNNTVVGRRLEALNKTNNSTGCNLLVEKSKIEEILSKHDKSTATNVVNLKVSIYPGNKTRYFQELELPWASEIGRTIISLVQRARDIKIFSSPVYTWTLKVGTKEVDIKVMEETDGCLPPGEEGTDQIFDFLLRRLSSSKDKHVFKLCQIHEDKSINYATYNCCRIAGARNLTICADYSSVVVEWALPIIIVVFSVAALFVLPAVLQYITTYPTTEYYKASESHMSLISLVSKVVCEGCGMYCSFFRRLVFAGLIIGLLFPMFLSSKLYCFLALPILLFLFNNHIQMTASEDKEECIRNQCKQECTVEKCDQKRAIENCNKKRTVEKCIQKCTVEKCNKKSTVEKCNKKRTVEECIQKCTVEECNQKRTVDCDKKCINKSKYDNECKKKCSSPQWDTEISWFTDLFCFICDCKKNIFTEWEYEQYFSCIRYLVFLIFLLLFSPVMFLVKIIYDLLRVFVCSHHYSFKNLSGWVDKVLKAVKFFPIFSVRVVAFIMSVFFTGMIFIVVLSAVVGLALNAEFFNPFIAFITTIIIYFWKDWKSSVEGKCFQLKTLIIEVCKEKSPESRPTPGNRQTSNTSSENLINRLCPCIQNCFSTKPNKKIKVPPNTEQTELLPPTKQIEAPPKDVRIEEIPPAEQKRDETSTKVTETNIDPVSDGHPSTSKQCQENTSTAKNNAENATDANKNKVGNFFVEFDENGEAMISIALYKEVESIILRLDHLLFFFFRRVIFVSLYAFCLFIVMITFRESGISESVQLISTIAGVMIPFIFDTIFSDDHLPQKTFRNAATKGKLENILMVESILKVEKTKTILVKVINNVESEKDLEKEPKNNVEDQNNSSRMCCC